MNACPDTNRTCTTGCQPRGGGGGWLAMIERLEAELQKEDGLARAAAKEVDLTSERGL